MNRHERNPRPFPPRAAKPEQDNPPHPVSGFKSLGSLMPKILREAESAKKRGPLANIKEKE